MPPKKLVAQPQLWRVHAVSVAKQFRVRMKPCSLMFAASSGYTAIVPALLFSSTRPSLTTTIPLPFPCCCRTSHDVRDRAAKAVLDVANYFFMVSRLPYNMKCSYLLFAFCLHFCLTFRVHLLGLQLCIFAIIITGIQNFFLKTATDLYKTCFLCSFWFENWVLNHHLINCSNLNLVNGSSYLDYSEYCPTAYSKMAIHEGMSRLLQAWIFLKDDHEW